MKQGAAISESAGLGFEIQTRLSEIDRYNAWIFEQFRPFVGRRVLDVGCALGNITQFFLDRELVIGLDVARDFVEAISRRFPGYRNFRAELFDIADPAVTALAVEEIDTIVCANVLEHLADDALALAHMRAILVPGGRLLLLVPAHPVLYGTMDAADEHHRRYTRRGLAGTITQAGFLVERLYPMNGLGIVGWFLNGKVLKTDLVPASHYRLYDRLVPVLAWLESIVRPPVGLSLVCIARRPGEGERGWR